MLAEKKDDPSFWKDITSINMKGSSTHGNKRQKYGQCRRSGGRRGRRRSYASHDEEEQYSIEMLMNDLQASCGFLLNIQKFTLCETDDDIPISSLCRLLKGMPRLRELVLEDILLEGEVTMTSQNQTSFAGLERVRLKACGPAEDYLLQWITKNAGSSVQELDLSSMLLRGSTMSRIPQQMFNLKKLHISCREFGALFDTLSHATALQELVTEGTFHPGETMNSLDLAPLEKLHTLQLSVAFTPFREKLLWDFLSPLNEKRNSSLRKLSLSLRASKSTQLVRSEFASFVTKTLENNPCLESLELCFAANFRIVREWQSLCDALQKPVDNLLEHNTTLTNLEVYEDYDYEDYSLYVRPNLRVCDDHPATFSWSPKTEFLLGLNRSGCRRIMAAWGQGLSVAKGVELLANAKCVFPETERFQVSMLYHILSRHPSWLRDAVS